MPVVPTLDPSQRVAPTTDSATPVNSAMTADLLTQGTRQVGQLGDALGQAANVQSQMAIDAQNLANQTRVNDALNQLKTQQQDLMYNPQTGVQSQTGLKALQRDSGMSLADEYTGKLNDSASQISSQLSNPVQQRLFAEQAGQITTQFHGATTQWEGQQFKSYALSTQDGTIKLATNQIGLSYNDPDAIDAGIKTIKAAVYQAGTISGHAATEIEANQRTMTSNALSNAIDTALQQGQITYANGLLKKYGSDMTADDMLKVNGKMTSYLGAQAAQNTVTRVMSAAGPALSNSPFDRMVVITTQSESGGHETNPDGSTVTSAKGAQGVMQVMPTTNTDPGFGVRPAQDSSPAERARVGRDYLQAMLAHYGGDPAKAWAAYNGGPKTLDDAMAKAQQAGAPGNWLTYMPKETQAYVQNNVATLQSNNGVPRPSKLDVLNAVRADPVLQQKPEWMTHAVTLASQQYDEQTAAIKQQDDATLAGVYRTLASNRGNINSVSPADLARVNPDDLPKVMTFAKQMNEGVNSTNTALYQTYITSPNVMAKMSNDQWQTQAPNFDEKDFKHLTQIRADILNGTGSNSPNSLNTGAMTQTLNQRLTSIGINPSPSMTGMSKDVTGAERVGAIRQFVTNSILDAQKEAGKKFSEAEISEHIDTLFAKSLTFRNYWDFGAFQTSGSNKTVNMMSMTAADIPGDIKTNLTNDFKARGVTNPTDGQLLGAYWTMKTLSQKSVLANSN
ncbi:lytic murein transglycosylase [Caballeronia arvi]|uniref:Lytic murein transglycosylase n=1 Tax=Caballeronia arvi TaxID=1777135 RepID=A0A158HT38_9BURK|nr:transglycosylase SLT domain-containing protein [Caballeronia arvi]SAL47496.1 lytic murein transglycosylase [Caballeronia arvi]